MPDKLSQYKRLVQFLGQVFDSNCEIALQDCRPGREGVIAIANGQISGRKIGSPLTDYALKIIQDGVWKNSDFQTNYISTTRLYKSLRSSTYFIKENGILLGMLCINIDPSKYQQLSDELLRLGGLFLGKNSEELNENTPKEVLFHNFADMFCEAINECFDGANVDVSKLKQNEKIRLIHLLNAKGVFLLKGAVSEVAQLLDCSEATVYRYLSKVNKGNKALQSNTP